MLVPNQMHSSQRYGDSGVLLRGSLTTGRVAMPPMHKRLGLSSSAMAAAQVLQGRGEGGQRGAAVTLCCGPVTMSLLPSIFRLSPASHALLYHMHAQRHTHTQMSSRP